MAKTQIVTDDILDGAVTSDKVSSSSKIDSSKLVPPVGVGALLFNNAGAFGAAANAMWTGARLELTGPGVGAAALKISDQNQAMGRVLTSDANGVATWQNNIASSGTHVIYDDGIQLANRLGLDFVGNGVTVADGGGILDKTVVTIPGPVPASLVYDTPGTGQTFVIPPTVSRVMAEVWGPGGNGGSSSSASGSGGGGGGGGGYGRQEFAVNAGDTYTINVSGTPGGTTSFVSPLSVVLLSATGGQTGAAANATGGGAGGAGGASTGLVNIPGAAGCGGSMGNPAAPMGGAGGAGGGAGNGGPGAGGGAGRTSGAQNGQAGGKAGAGGGGGGGMSFSAGGAGAPGRVVISW